VEKKEDHLCEGLGGGVFVKKIKDQIFSITQARRNIDEMYTCTAPYCLATVWYTHKLKLINERAVTWPSSTCETGTSRETPQNNKKKMYWMASGRG